MKFPPFFQPGEIAWVGVRAPILKPETATGETKLRPAMILGEVSPGRFMVIGLTSLSHYQDKRPRTAIPAELWAPVVECNSHLFRQPYLWGGSAPVVAKDDIAEHIAFAGPELRACIIASVSNVPQSLRSNVLRLQPEELAEAIASGAIPQPPPRQPDPDLPRPPAPAPAASAPTPAPEPAPEIMTTEPAPIAPTADVPDVPDVPEAEPEAELETQAAAEEATGAMHLSEEVLAALAVLAHGADASNPVFRSTFGPETVAALIADAQLGRRRQAESEAALLAARTALVAARSEISRLADGEPNWGGPETAAISEIDRTLAAAA